MHTTEDDPRSTVCFKTVVMDGLNERMQSWLYFNKYEITIAVDSRFK